MCPRQDRKTKETKRFAIDPYEMSDSPKSFSVVLRFLVPIHSWIIHISPQAACSPARSEYCWISMDLSGLSREFDCHCVWCALRLYCKGARARCWPGGHCGFQRRNQGSTWLNPLKVWWFNSLVKNPTSTGIWPLKLGLFTSQKDCYVIPPNEPYYHGKPNYTIVWNSASTTKWPFSNRENDDKPDHLGVLLNFQVSNQYVQPFSTIPKLYKPGHAGCFWRLKLWTLRGVASSGWGAGVLPRSIVGSLRGGMSLPAAEMVCI